MNIIVIYYMYYNLESNEYFLMTINKLLKECIIETDPIEEDEKEKILLKNIKVVEKVTGKKVSFNKDTLLFELKERRIKSLFKKLFRI